VQKIGSVAFGGLVGLLLSGLLWEVDVDGRLAIVCGVCGGLLTGALAMGLQGRRQRP
jgi:hypothetical protein